MAHRIPVAVITAGSLLAPLAPVVADARAQVPAPVRVIARNAATHGSVHGLVKDALGAAIVDASIVAVGQTIVSARSDLKGRFQLTVPPGDYILRATREGYVSTYREPVRVASSTRLERTITMTRQEDVLAAAGLADSHAHTELAWRLRHLTRSVLRDDASPGEVTGGEGPGGPAARGSFFGRAVDTSARLAAAFFSHTDFTGQVNVVTTASATPALSFAGAPPRSVAFIVLGAPIGASGDWRVRGAIASGADASWNLLGEYESKGTRNHALRVGVSYSAQDARVPAAGRLSADVIESRSVAGVFATDRWRALPGIELDYGVRADRYDYLVSPNLLSANAGLRARVLRATFVRVGAARAMVAPGADEFLPPPSQGPWLPPERTFSTLSRRAMLRAEDIRLGEVGVTREFGPAGRVRAVHVRAFRQETANQMATLFGVRDEVGLGHYHVADVGAVDLTGWAVGFSGSVFGALRGQVEYARLVADWHGGRSLWSVRRVAPSVLRPAVERLHDVSASLEASFNDAATRISLAVRSSSAFSNDGAGPEPLPGSRFDLQIHQALPYRPTRDSRLELLFAARTLFRDAAAGSSRFDELLTVAPPLRLMGGIQVRF